LYSYVEMLEQQQGQLVNGLQETYHRLLEAELWPGSPLLENEGHPLTHDILCRLEIIKAKKEGEKDTFEDDCGRLQQRLLAQGAPLLARRGSFGSESETSHDHVQDHHHNTSHSDRHRHKRARSSAANSETSPTSTPIFRHHLDPDGPKAPSPFMPSPVSQTSQQSFASVKPSPLQQQASPPQDSLLEVNDDFFMPSMDWQNIVPQPRAHPHLHLDEARYNFQARNHFNPMQVAYENSWQAVDPQKAQQFDANLMDSFTTLTPGPASNMVNLQDWQGVGMPMDFDFSKIDHVTV